MDVMHVVTDEHDTEGYPESRRPGNPFAGSTVGGPAATGRDVRAAGGFA